MVDFKLHPVTSYRSATPLTEPGRWDAIAAAIASLTGGAEMTRQDQDRTAYDFEFEALSGGTLALRLFEGRPMIVVNTASKCGFTPQYKDLQALWHYHEATGLVVLGVPCNDFGSQEPGTSAEIENFCAANYGVDFPMTAKVHVRGAKAHPFFKWLAAQGGFLSKPRWNFYKYLIGADGRLRNWFPSWTAPGSTRFARAVEKLIAEQG
jgi:glutathione peroxidase